MFIKIKNFIKNIFLAYSYFLLFLVAQSIALVGLFTVNLYFNMDFQNQFFDLLLPIYEKGNYLNNFDELLSAYLKLFEGIITPALLISNLLIVIIIGIKIKKKNKEENVIKKVSLKELFLYSGIGIFLNLAISLIISFLPAPLIENHSSSVSLALLGNPIILIISSGILAPLSEELIFRYGITKHLKKINNIFAIVVQALIFGIVHGNLVQGTYAFVLGLIFGIINYKKDNLAYSMILHTAINTSSVLLYCLNINEFLGLISLSLIFFIISIILKKTEK